MTTYPGALDTFINPISTTDLSDPTIPHASQHANINDAVKAVETELGVNPRGASATVVARLDANDVRAATKAPLASPTFTGTVTDNGNLVLTNQVAGTVAAVVKGAVSQTSNLMQFQDSGGSPLTRILSDGSVNINRVDTSIVSAGSSLGIQTPASNVGIVVKGSTSQTANLQEWQNSAGAVMSYFTSTGSLRVGVVGGSTAAFGSIAPASTIEVAIRASSAGNVPLLVSGTNSQTADLQQWQNGPGTVLSYIDATGQGFFNGMRINGTDNSSAIYMPGANPLGITSDRGIKLKVNQGNNPTGYPVVIFPVFAQTANLQEWQNSANTVLASVNSSGAIYTTLMLADTAAESSATGPYLRFLTGSITLQTRAATNVGLIIKGAASQTSNLQQWQNSASTIMAQVYADGGIAAPYAQDTVGNGAFITFRGGSSGLLVSTRVAGNVGLVVQGAASQTSNLQEWQNSAAAVLAKVQSDGSFVLPYIAEPSGTGSYIILNAGATGTVVTTRSSGNLGLVVKGVASQTADLQEWQNSSGTSIAAVTAGGVLQSTVAVYTPTIQQIGGGGASLNFATTQVGLYGHLASVTAIVVGATAGAGLGTTPPALVVTGTTDTRGVITFGTGTVPSIGADVVVAFATAYTSTPVVTITEQNGLTKALNLYISAVSTTGFTVSGLVAPAASQANTVYSVAYTVIG